LSAGRWSSSSGPAKDEEDAQRVLAETITAPTAQPRPEAAVNATGISVTTRRPLLNTFRNTRLQVDGGSAVVRRWGRSFIPVEPGRHVVRCYYPLNLAFRGGDASISIDVPDDLIVAIEYRAPFFGINPGTWKVTPTPRNEISEAAATAINAPLEGL